MAQMPRQTLFESSTAERNSQCSILLDFAFGLVAAHLLIERVEKLLPGGGAGEGGAVVKRPAKAAEIEQAFGRAVERNAHAVEQVDDAGRGVAHGFYGGLVGQEVAAVDRVIEVLPGGVAFALQVLGRVDAALCADGMGALYRDNGEQIHLAAHLGDLDDGGKTRQAAADNDNFRIRCHVRIPLSLNFISLRPVPIQPDLRPQDRWIAALATGTMSGSPDPRSPAQRKTPDTEPGIAFSPSRLT